MSARRGRGQLVLPALAATLLVAVLASAGGSSAAPQFVLMFRLAPPRASAGRALALGRSLGLEQPTVRRTPSSYVAADGAGRRTLALFRASGGFDYVDRDTFRRPPAGPLPTTQQARRIAIELLRTRNLLPAGNVRIVVRPDSRSSPTSQVVTVAPLAAGAPVLDGAITFWLGAHGSIERLRDEYRPATTTAIRVNARPRAMILKEIHDDVGAARGIRLRLAYVAQPSYLPQPYLEPVYEALSGGYVIDRVRATTFTPRATTVSPALTGPVAAGSNVRLRARGSEGRRPYRFRWDADASGFLGYGKSIYTPLRADDTEIRLTIRDSSGAGTTLVQPVRVTGARTESGIAPAAGPFGDGTIRFDARQDAAHPLVFRDVEAGGVRRVTAVYFDQFRYVVAVRFLGAEYHITSRKCVPLTAPGDACTLPKGPYGHSGGASPPAASALDSRVDSTLAVDNLPGRLKLVAEGSAAPAYCGPTGELGAIALELLPKFVVGAGTALGQDCPGFRASVEWSYSPPATFRPSDFARLCLQSAGLCDVPQAQLSQWATGALDNGPQPQIADFRLSVYTAVVPSGGAARAGLAKDGDRLLTPAATDGPPDLSCARPIVCISPIASERAAALAGPSDWDELYLKSEAPEARGVAFPYCNRALNEQDLPDCIHLRDRSPAQEATVFIVRGHVGEASPDSVESLLDGEPLRQDADHGYDLVLWLRSTASSTECYPSGGVDNAARPCRVLSTPLFFTPR